MRVYDDSDADLAKLDEYQLGRFRELRELMYEMDELVTSGLPVYRAANQVAEHHAGDISYSRQGQKLSRNGKSASNINLHYTHWISAGKSDAALVRYSRLILNKSLALEKNKLTKGIIDSYLGIVGLSIKQWAAKHRFSPEAVYSFMDHKRHGGKIINQIGAKFRAEIEVEVIKMLKELSDIAAEIDSHSKRAKVLKAKIKRLSTKEN